MGARREASEAAGAFERSTEMGRVTTRGWESVVGMKERLWKAVKSSEGLDLAQPS